MVPHPDLEEETSLIDVVNIELREVGKGGRERNLITFSPHSGFRAFIESWVLSYCQNLVAMVTGQT